jgi:hypothetical protein
MVEMKKKRNERNNPFNMGNFARKVPNATASLKKYQRYRARDAQLLASAGVGAHALDRL